MSATPRVFELCLPGRLSWGRPGAERGVVGRRGGDRSNMAKLAVNAAARWNFNASTTAATHHSNGLYSGQGQKAGGRGRVTRTGRYMVLKGGWSRIAVPALEAPSRRQKGKY